MHPYATRFAHLNRSVGTQADPTYVAPRSVQRWNPVEADRRVTRSMAAAAAAATTRPRRR